MHAADFAIWYWSLPSSPLYCVTGGTTMLFGHPNKIMRTRTIDPCRPSETLRTFRNFDVPPSSTGPGPANRATADVGDHPHCTLPRLRHGNLVSEPPGMNATLCPRRCPRSRRWPPLDLRTHGPAQLGSGCSPHVKRLVTHLRACAGTYARADAIRWCMVKCMASSTET